jgi:hypothetical protein
LAKLAKRLETAIDFKQDTKLRLAKLASLPAVAALRAIRAGRRRVRKSGTMGCHVGQADSPMSLAFPGTGHLHEL